MRYGILGVTQAADDLGTPITVGGPRLRALLTALALRGGRTATPETLIDEVWADDPPQDAPAALQALVGRLRRALGRDAVASETGGYRLTATRDDVDLFVFERLVRSGTAALGRDDAVTAAAELRQALALWRGPALADLPDRGAAARPEALRMEATRARLTADLRLGRASDAVPELHGLTADHPYDEPLHALLIRALRAAGRHADALTAYETVRRALADGLGTDPGPQLRALHREMLTNDTSGISRDTSQGVSPEAPPVADHGLPPGTDPGTGRGLASARGPAPKPRPASGSGSAPASGAASALAADPHTPIPRAPRNGNIRRRLDSFVGREPEIDAIRSDVQRARLVTLTGPGGSGKTRLAEEAATGLPQAWLAELAPLDRPEAVPGAVVSALGLRETVLITNEMSAAVLQDDPLALLVEYCAPRSLLLILDNCEHVIGAAAALAETLLTRCPGLTILATSREPLGVPGELARPVEPLPPSAAHRLFMERAAAVRPGTDAVRDPGAVDEICRRLDGLPLAIELAAARLRLLTPRQIADRLDDRFRLLTSGSRTVLPRQQTLRAVVDWSWDLLDEQERTVLCEASVFAGGWDLAAAEAVCTGPAADLVGALVDKSLIVATPYGDTGRDHDSHGGRSDHGDHDGHGGTRATGGTGMRYRMLETIHEYAGERAAQSPGLRAAAELRHRAWVRALTEEAEPQLRSAGQLPWIGRLETELDNIRAALHRAALAGAEEEAGAVALAMGWFWWLRNFRLEGAEWTDYVLRLGALLDTDPAGIADGRLEDPEAVRHFTAFLTAEDGERDHPLHEMRMSLRMQQVFLLSETQPADVLRDRLSAAYMRRVCDHFNKGGPQAARLPGLIWPMGEFFLGASAALRAGLDAALANCREYGGDWEIGVVLMFRTHMIVDSSGGLLEVDDDLAELRTLSRRTGDRWMRAQVASAAGEAAMARGRFDDSKGEYEEALRLAYEVGAYAETPFLIARLAELAYRAGDRPVAEDLLDEAATAADRHGVVDSRAFVLLLRAHLALDDGAVSRARELCRAAFAEAGHGTPPPQFIALLRQAEAMVTAAESGPLKGLAELTEAVRGAVETHCAEWVTGSLVDNAARMLAAAGDHPRAVRLVAASGHWRGRHRRPAPEGRYVEGIEAEARTLLGVPRYEAERAAGTALTPDDVLRELADALAEAPTAVGQSPAALADGPVDRHSVPGDDPPVSGT
ncbi:BTAD domain-containing putative transcriptional regulator [Streptomyces sp. NPDC059785]|uniref:AfsR/SARP family transcriptional regulator n=1 Tax=Streptomyces sp. NPDC059785 TaxID=3346945 RepID=UPI003646CBC6